MIFYFLSYVFEPLHIFKSIQKGVTLSYSVNSNFIIYSIYLLLAVFIEEINIRLISSASESKSSKL